jgi:hypothetical protein
VFAEGVKDTKYRAQGLTPGTKYLFVIQSRNAVGLSDYSNPITVFAAQIPDAPENLANVAATTSSSQIALNWSPPTFNGGSKVLDYRIWYDNASGGELVVLESNLT